MVDFTITGIVWLDIAILIGTGGLGVALFNHFSQRSIRNREEFTTLSTYKIDTISKSKPYLVRLANLYVTLSYALVRNRDKVDYLRCFYLVCNILSIRQKIQQEYGDVQFDNINAEEVISAVSEYFINQLLDPSTNVSVNDISRMSDLVSSGNPYYLFIDDVNKTEVKKLLDKFESWLKKLDDSTYENLRLTCLCYYGLTNLEVTYLYRIWYKSEPKFSNLDRDIVSYIEMQMNGDNDKMREIYRNYYNRISSFGLGRKDRLLRKLNLNRTIQKEAADG